jgi:hypothetical protein
VRATKKQAEKSGREQKESSPHYSPNERVKDNQAEHPFGEKVDEKFDRELE